MSAALASVPAVSARPHSVRRRIVILFIICGLIPVAGAVLSSYRYVERELLGERATRLSEAASIYATVLVDRLGDAERAALEAVASGRYSGPDAGPQLRRLFRSGITYGPAGAKTLFGAPEAFPLAGDFDLDRLPLAGQSHLLVSRARGGETRIWLALPAAPGDRGPAIVLEVDPAYLWARHEPLPDATETCVLSLDGRAISCARPPPAQALLTFLGQRAVDGRGAPRDGEILFPWTSDDVRLVSGARELFLEGRFGAAAWIVTATQDHDRMLEPVHALAARVLPSILIGILLTALLGMIHVRRTLRPLNTLSESARRVAEGDFSMRIKVERDDELGILAATFNGMSERLGRQFAALHGQAEIDAAILDGADLDRVAKAALAHLPVIAPAARHWLILADSGTAHEHKLYAIDETGSLSTTKFRLPAGTTLREPASRTGAWVAHDSLTRDGVFEALHDMRVFAVSFGRDTEVDGAVLLGLADTSAPNGETIDQLRRYADRIAVALGTARRGEELHRRAFFDSLTELPNRAMGIETLARAVAGAARHQRNMAVLFVDLNGFSEVNDEFGHAAGDAVLVESAARLRDCMRRSDLVARLGGDEFAVVLPEIRDTGDAAVVARHIVEALESPINVGVGSARVSASIGVAVYPGDGTNAEELLKCADLAMYHAKQAEGDGERIVFFTQSMNEQMVQRKMLDRDLRRALELEQFQLYYQPQLELATGRITGCEALIRWLHPERGMVPPMQFIGHAESTGLIEQIGSWALGEACMQFMSWRARGLSIEHVSVNASPREFRLKHYAASVADIVRASGIPAHCLHIEITESAVLGDHDAVHTNLDALTALGTPIELDDFGTGYSSLAHLRDLPVQVVKLDRSFIKPIHEDAAALEIVRAAIRMTPALGKTVVAEGVELAEHRDLLSSIGCDTLQGYLLSPPVPAEKFEALVRAQSRGAAPRSHRAMEQATA